MQARMRNPVVVLPAAMQPIQDLKAARDRAGLPQATVSLVHLRVSQINGCSACVDAGAREARDLGETHERLSAVAAWRDAPYYTDAERAALALTEAVTRLGDRPDPVPDDVWETAAKHHNEAELAGLIISIVLSNIFNRLNVPTRQPAGAWG